MAEIQSINRQEMLGELTAQRLLHLTLSLLRLAANRLDLATAK